MRAGACAAAHQTLSAEAASVLNLSLRLARRRGHSQATPLHVAATLLISPTSTNLLKIACLKSQQPHHHHHHPLNYSSRALELCFNVALNRLPASSPAPLIHAPPSLSNALVAALKRAQAHQKRGCVEQQQQQQRFLGIKVELEQLILSILDDPSVSRVMREAGFSSTSVKNNLEGARTPTSTFLHSNLLSYDQNPLLFSSSFREEDMKCQMKQPPPDGLGLSLNAASGRDARISLSQNLSQATDKKLFCLKEEQDEVILTCCQECKSNYEKEVGFNSILHKFNNEKGSAQLPYWLKPHSNETFEKEHDLVQLRRKYNKLCQNRHNSISGIIDQCYLGKKNHNYQNSSFPCWPNKNNIFADSETVSFANSTPWFRRQQSCHIEFSFCNGSPKNQSMEPNLDSLKTTKDKEVQISLTLGNSMYAPTNKKIVVNANLCSILQENVPWQSENIPLIVEAVIDSEEEINQDKVLLIQGNDIVGKRRLAHGIAKYMFGSYELLFCMNMRNNDDNTVSENREMLEKALENHEKLVVLIEDVDYADPEFAKFLFDGFEVGKSCRRGAIFILTMKGDTSYYNIASSVIQMKLLVQESNIVGLGLPLFGRKRKMDWDCPIRGKSLRNNETEEVSSDVFENGIKREFKKQISSNSLDLNIKADEDDDMINESISSDLTREITMEQDYNTPRFLKNIKNCFVLNRDSDRDERAREMFLSKFKRSFHEATNKCRNISSFNVEDALLEEVLQGSGFYLNSLFEQWLKDIFETSLRIVGERRMVSVRLCLGGKGESYEEDGFMGTRLPKRIPVSYIG